MPRGKCAHGVLRLVFLALVLTTCLANAAIHGKNTTLSPSDAPTTATGAFKSPSRGTGLAFAESCQAALRVWSSSADSYGSAHATTSTSYHTGIITINSQLPGLTEIHSLITLCDGYPRVIGRVTYSTAETTTITETWTNTNPTLVLASYTTPAPCSIGPEDCKLLYRSWTSHWNEFTLTNTVDGLLDPPCTTETTTRTYSTNSRGGSCDNCQVIGSKIRLLYWPVITRADSGNLCSKSPETVTVAPSGNGPNTFVTAGITITSPSVAVSIGGLSRVDKCGTVISDTIIPVLPEDVSSVEGARALFTHKQFNFADLNYRCLSDPSTIFVTTGTRSDCYQEVPASAYFYGLANAAGVNWYASTAFANSTIWPNYQPQVLPPNTLSKAIQSIWGEDCNIHPDGVWDPPIALGQEKQIPAPEAGCTSITYLPETSIPAMPAAPTMAHASPTPAGTTATGAIVPTIIASSSSPSAVDVLHTTVISVTAPKQVLTMEDAEGRPALMNGHTTLMLGSEGEQGVPEHAPSETTSSSPSSEVVTLGPGRYIVEMLGNGDVNVAGSSTTIDLAGISPTIALGSEAHDGKTAPHPEATGPAGSQSEAGKTGDEPETHPHHSGIQNQDDGQSNKNSAPCGIQHPTTTVSLLAWTLVALTLW